MDNKYLNAEAVFKALADKNRLVILELLKNGELYADNILSKLDVTQPTLSHHMKILCASGIVDERKAGRRSYYSISDKGKNMVFDLLEEYIISDNEKKEFETKRKARRKDNIVIL